MNHKMSFGCRVEGNLRESGVGFPFEKNVVHRRGKTEDRSFGCISDDLGIEKAPFLGHGLPCG
eukprot:GAFH01002407.1.p4 GENE.GAFH01002407.1~~GAFH01002407.1.p4  ORF type:complete len:63 (+),score=4.66 GAFH01002407.1:311-499(+)